MCRAASDCNHLGSNASHRQLFPLLKDKKRFFPLAADLLSPTCGDKEGDEMVDRPTFEAAEKVLNEKGLLGIEQDKNYRLWSKDRGAVRPTEYTPRGYELIAPQDRPAGPEAPCRYPWHVSRDMVFTFIREGDGANWNTEEPDQAIPECPCRTQHRPEYGGVRPPEADFHIMVTARE